MTNKNDNDDAQSSNTESNEENKKGTGIRRRSIIAATLSSPAIVGLGFGAADKFAIPGPSVSLGGSASPIERASAGSSVQAQMDSATADLGEESAQGLPLNRYRVLHANQEVLDTLEREPGEQVRVTRAEDTAVYTLAEMTSDGTVSGNETDDDDGLGTGNETDDDGMGAGNESDDDDGLGAGNETDDNGDMAGSQQDDTADGALVRTSREGKCRLAFYEDMEFDDDRRWGPLRGDEVCEMVDEGFEVEIDPRVPAEDVDQEQADEEGDLVETFVEGETAIAALAPHGGQMQPFTDEQVELMLSEFSDATGWMLQGYGQNTSFYRWYVPSADMSEASYPGLAQLSEETYDLAVSFSGITGQNIYVGGTADEALRQEIVDAIDEALPDDGSPVMLGEDQYAADSEETLVNRITQDQSNGIWIGQPIADRRNSWDVIVEAVGSVLSEE